MFCVIYKVHCVPKNDTHLCLLRRLLATLSVVEFVYDSLSFKQAVHKVSHYRNMPKFTVEQFKFNYYSEKQVALVLLGKLRLIWSSSDTTSSL